MNQNRTLPTVRLHKLGTERDSLGPPPVSACLNIKTRYGDVTLKNVENVIVFYHIWLVFIDRVRSRKCQRTIKKSKKKTTRSRTINNDKKKTVVNFRSSTYMLKILKLKNVQCHVLINSFLLFLFLFLHAKRKVKKKMMLTEKRGQNG